MIWIGYTTLYREGGPKFERAARTLERDLCMRDSKVLCERIESKRDFVDAMKRIDTSGSQLDELHLIGHSGMYGPMFRTAAMPEQFSPHEWRSLRIPFAEGARAYFHACRTARWFAPFFARTFGVRSYGYHPYTTVSSHPRRFRWEALSPVGTPLYLIACPGKKSHGILGSAMKYSGLARAEEMKTFDPLPPEGDTSYDSIADLYDRVFSDISVREDECRYIEARVPKGARVLDVGCGNGALLRKLSPRIASGVGVDISSRMIERSRARSRDHTSLSFQTITGPVLPFSSGSFDVIVSLLSFRYLDWDPIMNELRRLLKPGGRIIIVDMVTVPSRIRELPRVVRHKLRQLLRHRRNPAFARSLKQLVRDPRWQTMLRYNPIRADHEFRWYLESRFPGHSPEPLTVAYDTRVLGFDSGPLEPGWIAPQSYP